MNVLIGPNPSDRSRTPYDTLLADQYKKTIEACTRSRRDSCTTGCYSRLCWPDLDRAPRSSMVKSTNGCAIGPSRFRRDPAAAALVNQIKAASDELKHARSVTSRGDDPALVAANNRLAKLNQEYHDLWIIHSSQRVNTLRKEIESLKEKKSELTKLVDRYRELEGKAVPEVNEIDICG